SFATLSGTLALDRFHETSAAVAPAPPGASLGIAEPVEIETVSYVCDAFGNVTEVRAPEGRCSAVSFESVYADLPVQETALGGDLGANGCGERAFVTSATYDRGLSLVLTTTDITGQPAKFDYDGFGRLVAETYVDPDQPGQLATRPSLIYDYLTPVDWRATPYSVIVVRAQDGETVDEDAYHERYQYGDGLGRALIVLSEADPTAGDGGSYVAGGTMDYGAKGQPLRAFENRFWSGNPLAYPLNEAPALRYTSQLYDAFGRATEVYALDGQLDLATVYHALGMDRWDAADLSPGPHASSFASVRMDGHGRQVEAIERVRAGGVLEQRRLLSESLPSGEVRRVI